MKGRRADTCGGRPRGLSDERGVVLLIVLVVVSLLTIIVLEFTDSVQLDRYRAYNAEHALQAGLLARSAVNIEESFLVMDKEPRFDAFTEDWWVQLREFCAGIPLSPTMRIACDLEDESGKLNINLTRMSAASLQAAPGEERKTRDAFARDALRRLFDALGIEVDTVDRLIEYWTQEPPEDERGRKQRIPDFASLEDFAAKFSISSRYLRKLRRVLTAVPTRYIRTINANTAPAIVLSAVINDAAAVGAIIERQQSEEAFQTAAEVRSVLQEQGVEDASVLGQMFGVRSSLFRLYASGVTNADPTGEQPGGIGQTLSELVVRRRDTRRGRTAQDGPGWTLRPLDWQKEGGARLLEQRPYDENEGLGQRDDQRSDGSSTF